MILRWRSLAWPLCTLGALAVLGSLGLDRLPLYRLSLVNVALMYFCLAVCLDLTVGDTGLFSLSHTAMFGIGAYGFIVLAQVEGLNLWLAALASLGIATAIALAIAIPACQRTGGLFFAMVTFAAAQLLAILVNSNSTYTGGSEGLRVTFLSTFPAGLNSYQFLFEALIAVAAGVAGVAWYVRRSRFGLELHAIRDDEPLAKALGIRTTQRKVTIFVLTSCLAAIVGMVYNSVSGFVTPDPMGANEGIYILGLILIGGAASIQGSVIGVCLLALIPQLLSVNPVWLQIGVGCFMALVIIVAPTGIWGTLRSIARLGRRVVEVRRLGVPQPLGASEGAVEGGFEGGD